jgi:Zn ribbon nucleic-acid-binding protein
MGSVIDHIECPNCKREAFMDFYYKTGEEYVNCNSCGYYHSLTYKRDNNGNLITKDGKDDYSFDNLIMEEKKLKEPYSAYRIKYYDSVATQCGSLANESEYNELMQHLSNNESIEFASTSRLLDGKIVEEIIIDNSPKVDSAGFTKEEK